MCVNTQCRHSAIGWRERCSVAVQQQRADACVAERHIDRQGVGADAAALCAPVVLSGTEEANLDEGDHNQGQGVVDDAPWDCKVVEGATVQHLCSRLKPCASPDVCAVGLRARE